VLFPPQSLFVTGTDTEIGKTTALAALARTWVRTGAQVAAMKPVAAGLVNGVSEDLMALEAACNVHLPRALACPYALAQPIAPHLAAASAGVRIEVSAIERAYRDSLRWLAARRSAELGDSLAEPARSARTPAALALEIQARSTDTATAVSVVVEGAGGALVPLNAHEDMLDIAAVCDLPVVFVVGLRLGCINHARLTEWAIIHRRLRCLGWIANTLHPDMPFLHKTVETLQNTLKSPLLGICPYRGEVLFAKLTDA
jgi:dethiobiotin synthetase